MKLRCGEIRPGKVLAVIDNYGNIKASCCGVFSDQDNIDDLPPVRPFLKVSSSSFCEPQLGDPVWVFLFSDNPLELFYVFQGDAKTTVGDDLGANYDDVEILSRHGDGTSSLLWSDVDGWKMSQGSSNMNMDTNGDIRLSKDAGEKYIDVNSNGIHLGAKDGTANPAVLGNELKDALQTLTSALSNAAAAAKSNPQTMQIGIALEGGLLKFNNKIGNILSSNVTLD